MNTKARFTEDELQDIWSALAYYISNTMDEGNTETKKAMKKIIKKIRAKK